mgnify:CR=1 FL=1
MSAKLLYDLQLVDNSIAQVEESLRAIESKLGDRSALAPLEQRITTLKQQLADLEKRIRSQELEEGSTRQKLQTLERRMYGGEVTNPRELEGMGAEQKLLHARLEKQEEALLDLMSSQEEVEQALGAASAKLEAETRCWEEDQGRLAGEKEAGLARLKELIARRQVAMQPLDEESLKIYEQLRATKHGLAVSKVERGLCTACKMVLAVHIQQRARTGRETVFCQSCGRILYIS